MARDQTIQSRAERYAESMRRKGHVLVKVWVPQPREQEFKALAAEWREQHEANAAPRGPE